MSKYGYWSDTAFEWGKTPMYSFEYLSVDRPPVAVLKTYGPVLYRTPDGVAVKVMAVGDYPDPKDGGYMWPDAVCVGEVVPADAGGFIGKAA